jgi:hypothetical protein
VASRAAQETCIKAGDKQSCSRNLRQSRCQAKLLKKPAWKLVASRVAQETGVKAGDKQSCSRNRRESRWQAKLLKKPAWNDIWNRTLGFQIGALIRFLTALSESRLFGVDLEDYWWIGRSWSWDIRDKLQEFGSRDAEEDQWGYLAADWRSEFQHLERYRLTSKFDSRTAK